MVDCVRVTHPCAAVRPVQAPTFSLDLHVLSLPLAFILSQDQTLHSKVLLLTRRQTVLLELTVKSLMLSLKLSGPFPTFKLTVYTVLIRLI